MRLGDGTEEVAVFEVDVDTDVDPGATDLDLAAGGGLVARARVSLEEALGQIEPTLSKVADTVRELGPDTAELGFGLKMGGETGVIIAKGTAEVNFSVRLTWNRP
ncbi:CU044_2847 family protein [Streptomyces aureocirculatus]|uniref:CU044_2847 family protein n=1 Tax=Streptomyces aureocirculatus TaxID=67275 RepID=UPI0004CB9D9D|nr:CU044_2847 family protein [Streptomyces aureocirculatus]